MPRSALTVGVATVMDAREVVIIITGIHKAFALSQCIERGVSHMWTVSMIQLHPRYVSRAAVALLCADLVCRPNHFGVPDWSVCTATAVCALVSSLLPPVLPHDCPSLAFLSTLYLATNLECTYWRWLSAAPTAVVGHASVCTPLYFGRKKLTDSFPVRGSTPFCPLYVIPWTHSACIACDEDATAELRVKTVKYFKGIQETMVRPCASVHHRFCSWSLGRTSSPQHRRCSCSWLWQCAGVAWTWALDVC